MRAPARLLSKNPEPPEISEWTRRALVSRSSTEPRDVPIAELAIVFARTFLPALEDDASAYAGRLQIQPANAPLSGRDAAPWFPLARSVSADDAIIAHLRAGLTGEPQPLGRRGRLVRAIGARYREDELVGFWALDLDGGVEPRLVLSALSAKTGARFMVTPGSGRPGRVRAWLRLSEPLPVHELQALSRRLLIGLGFPPSPGSVESYPAAGFSRLPFGLGGCSLLWPETDPGEPGIPVAPSALLSAFFRLPAFDLRRAADEHGAPEEKKPKPRRARPRRVKGRLSSSTPPDVARWLEHGANPGERQAMSRRIAQDSWWLGHTEAQAVSRLRDLHARGKFSRTNQARENPRAAETFSRDFPRIVRSVFRRMSSMPAKQGKRAARNLSAREVRALEPIVIRAAEQTGATVARVGALVLRILPSMKGSPAGARIAMRAWRAAAGGESDYGRIRDALGIFEPRSGYLPATRAARREAAHAMTWGTSFAFDDESPARALGRTWETAIDRARRSRTKPDKTLPPVSPPVEKASADEHDEIRLGMAREFRDALRRQREHVSPSVRMNPDKILPRASESVLTNDQKRALRDVDDPASNKAREGFDPGSNRLHAPEYPRGGFLRLDVPRQDPDQEKILPSLQDKDPRQTDRSETARAEERRERHPRRDGDDTERADRPEPGRHPPEGRDGPKGGESALVVDDGRHESPLPILSCHR